MWLKILLLIIILIIIIIIIIIIIFIIIIIIIIIRVLLLSFFSFFNQVPGLYSIKKLFLGRIGSITSRCSGNEPGEHRESGENRA